MSRGGKRPRAGAPKGNANALKTGRYSQKVKEILDQVPDSGFILYTKKGGLQYIHRGKK